MIARLLVVAAVVLVISNTAYRRKQILRAVEADNEQTTRYVDTGVTLHVVRADPKGRVLIEGLRPMVIVRTHELGGIIDTKATPPRFTGAPSTSPQVWYCSEDQEPLILHGDEMPIGQLALGGMGAGKTTAGVMWLYVRWLEEMIDRADAADSARAVAAQRGDRAVIPPAQEGGITAPTETRLSVVTNEILAKWPTEWRRYNTETKVITMCDGFRIRGVSTHRQSASQGSRLQGFSWTFWLGDELQDQCPEFTDIQARLRAKRNGKAKRLATATAKDATEWRDLKGAIEKSSKWTTKTLMGPRSPFVDPEHWNTMKQTMSLRDYQRYVEAVDMPPELAVYYGWLRSRNLVNRPQIARDVTHAVLAGYQSYLHPRRSFGLLLGHDPGVIYNTTEVLSLVMFGDVPTWIVVGELQTKQTTAHDHVAQLKAYLREHFYVDHPTIGGPLAMAFIDPHGKGQGQTDYQSVYMAFQRGGIDAFSPAAQTGRIKRTARVEMMNRLLSGTAAQAGVPRLVVAQDDYGKPVAPRLVESFEALRKRPGDDDPEGSQTKNEDDQTHAPVATAYALWMFEQEALTQQTIDTALRAVKGRPT